jgi:hypothetical protein
VRGYSAKMKLLASFSMSIINYLEINTELKQLFNEIYTQSIHENLIGKVTRFIEIVIELTDSGKINKVQAAYIITDILLKYDDDDIYEKVFNESMDLELADAKFKSYSEEDIEAAWERLKFQFEQINNPSSKR